MKEDLKKVLESVITHNTFLNKSDVLKAIEQSYEIGLNEEHEKYDMLKKAFEELLEKMYDCENHRMEGDFKEYWRKKGGVL